MKPTYAANRLRKEFSRNSWYLVDSKFSKKCQNCEYRPLVFLSVARWNERRDVAISFRWGTGQNNLWPWNFLQHSTSANYFQRWILNEKKTLLQKYWPYHTFWWIFYLYLERHRFWSYHHTFFATYRKINHLIKSRDWFFDSDHDYVTEAG